MTGRSSLADSNSDSIHKGGVHEVLSDANQVGNQWDKALAQICVSAGLDIFICDSWLSGGRA